MGVDRLRRVNGSRAWVAMGVAVVALLGTAAGAAAATSQDQVSDVELGVACAPGDNTQVYLRFHVDAGADTAATGRVTDIDFVHAGDYTIHFDAPGGAAHFATGDYEFPLSANALRSTIDGDTFDVTISYANGDVAASKSVTVACFEGGADATTHDFTVKARVGVPRTFWLLEHATFGSNDRGFVSRAWVTEDGAVVDPIAASSDLLDLEPATDAALGASLADRGLTVTPTAAGTYELDWGIVEDYPAYTRVEITSDPQVVSFPYSQDIFLDMGSWAWDEVPDCVQDGGGLWVCTPGVGSWTPPTVEHLVGPTTYTFEGFQVLDVYVKTGETVEARGPSGMTIEVIDAPIQPDPSEIVEGSRGDVDVSETANPGQTLTVDLGDDSAGGYVDVWLNSTPTYLGLYPVGPGGTVDVTIPSSFAAGEHRVVVTDEVGNFMGWDDLRVVSASGGLAVTGPDDDSWIAYVAAAAALVGAGLVAVRVSRREH